MQLTASSKINMKFLIFVSSEYVKHLQYFMRLDTDSYSISDKKFMKTAWGVDVFLRFDCLSLVTGSAS